MVTRRLFVYSTRLRNLDGASQTKAKHKNKDRK